MRSQMRAAGASISSLRDTVGTSFVLVGDEAENVVPGEALTPAQECQLDHERTADDLGARRLDEVAACTGGAAGREQVVVDEHARPARESVRVHVQGVDA